MGSPFLLSAFSELGSWLGNLLSGRNECGSFLKPHHSPLNVKPFKRGSTVVASGSCWYGCARQLTDGLFMPISQSPQVLFNRFSITFVI